MVVGGCVMLGLLITAIVLFIRQPIMDPTVPAFYVALLFLLCIVFIALDPPWSQLNRLTVSGRYVHSVNVVNGRTIQVDLDNVKAAVQHRIRGPKRYSMGHVRTKLTMHGGEEFEISQDVYSNYKELVVEVLGYLQRRSPSLLGGETI